MSKLHANVLAAAERRGDARVRIGLAAVLVIFAVAVVMLIVGGRDTASEAAVVPTAVTETGAIRAVAPEVELEAGTDSPRRVVTIYEDYQCPACKNFEATFGGTLDELRTTGTAAIDYHPIAFLDRMSTTGYSSRAANASVCVAESAIDSWRGFHSAAYAQQPPEGGQGLSDDQLSEIAVAAGAPESVSECISSGRYNDWVESSTHTILGTDVNSTPTVLLNGTLLDLTTPEALSAAVLAIR
ncbi:DsbA family protein [Rhodococcus pyridinivorans]|uniref:DsbA family protein n=1 Tax=Rhodococcus pyridinivorans TaxID=103816 RepID=UPI0020791B24|nr:DsbA family protein [Rhodococcus pyridinivorans]USI93086.1 DsbA family protein [Rhodococcus pyridinivorans]